MEELRREFRTQRHTWEEHHWSERIHLPIQDIFIPVRNEQL
jgi:hypothetical protein